jgi:lipid II isoglutaminyl synthase (glutamine-hydrolysing)
VSSEFGPRERVAALVGRATGALARRAGRGGGTALPGLVAGRLAPRLLERAAASMEHGVLCVSGTNGKTTTTHLLTAIAAGAGLDPLTNGSGSNLERGLLAAFVQAGGRAGGLDGAGRVGLLEVDEAVLPLLLPRLAPRVVVLLNLFRDQLDRYGEVDSVAEGWRRMLVEAESSPTLVLNADDPAIAMLAEDVEEKPGARVIHFGVEAPNAERAAEAAHGGAGAGAVDARFCRCGARIAHDALLLGHLGAWRCPSCGRARPTPEVEAGAVELTDAGASFELRTRLPGAGLQRARVELPLAGLHSVYNALAAAAGALALGVSPLAAAHALAGVAPAFGRQEAFAVEGRQVRLLLAKNPTGLTEVVRTLTAAAAARGAGAAEDEPALHLLFALNDGVQDGRDTSWIYDADVEALAGRVEHLVASGLRADDMALRLLLARVRSDRAEPRLAEALDAALAATPAGGTLSVVATYTAMLELREELARRAGRAHYWERDADGAAVEGVAREAGRR